MFFCLAKFNISLLILFWFKFSLTNEWLIKVFFPTFETNLLKNIKSFFLSSEINFLILSKKFLIISSSLSKKIMNFPFAFFKPKFLLAETPRLIGLFIRIILELFFLIFLAILKLLSVELSFINMISIYSFFFFFFLILKLFLSVSLWLLYFTF